MTHWLFDRHHASDWEMASWANGQPFNAGFSPENIEFDSGRMRMTINDKPYPDPRLPFSAAEYRSRGTYKYGFFEARMKIPRASGIVTSFFTYCGPYEGNPHDEIDIEFEGRDTTKVQFNYHTNDVGTNRNEWHHELGFDAADGFHDYGFRWSPQRIQWYVDGIVVHTETSARTGVPVPSNPGKIMMNTWPGIGVDGWLGPFEYAGPLEALVESVKYEP